VDDDNDSADRDVRRRQRRTRGLSHLPVQVVHIVDVNVNNDTILCTMPRPCVTTTFIRQLLAASTASRYCNRRRGDDPVQPHVHPGRLLLPPHWVLPSVAMAGPGQARAIIVIEPEAGEGVEGDLDLFPDQRQWLCHSLARMSWAGNVKSGRRKTEQTEDPTTNH